MNNYCVIIPTLNEENNIRQVINNLKSLNCDIFIIDSNSTDGTLKIAQELNVKVFQGEWNTFSEKMNWALKAFSASYGWVIRIDADERINIKQKNLISKTISQAGNDVSGININRKIFFMGRRLRYGGMGSHKHCRITRTGFAKYEIREMDEHILTDGLIINSAIDVEEHETRGISNWSTKHIKYANIEKSMWLNNRHRKTWVTLKFPEKAKRFLKEEIFNRTPLVYRAVGYFFYRYIFLMGFLDGIPGLIFHVFHSLWYRLLIDTLILQENHESK
jgi:glycosyltransferase involved in cell wall biosynthesis